VGPCFDSWTVNKAAVPGNPLAVLRELPLGRDLGVPTRSTVEDCLRSSNTLTVVLVVVSVPSKSSNPKSSYIPFMKLIGEDYTKATSQQAIRQAKYESCGKKSSIRVRHSSRIL
jgi:hypothetical protein